MKANNLPHLRFYLKNRKEIPMKIISRDEYDELNSYEPMMYRPENWEKYDIHQLKDLEFFKNQLKELGYIPQVQKIAVLNREDFLNKKDKVESEDGFVKWFN
jgi:hypothetical protein